MTHAQPTLPALTEKDLRDVEVAAECGADFVALSFVRTAEDVGQVRERLDALNSRARIIAKIEKVEAFENLDSILEAADGVMVARGDYGVEAGLARVPLMQKSTIHRATQAGKLVITATQMLESMIDAPEPTRAEATDVANAVIDGTSAVMLSAETGVGAYPVEAVRAMAEFAEVAEEAQEIFHAAHTIDTNEPDTAVMFAAVALGSDVEAAALVIPTSTGGTPRACAKYRRAGRSSRSRTTSRWPTSSRWSGASIRGSCRPCPRRTLSSTSPSPRARSRACRAARASSSPPGPRRAAPAPRTSS